MPISDKEMNDLIADAEKNKESAFDLLKKRFSHLEPNDLDWVGVKLRRVMDEKKGIPPKDAPPFCVVPEAPQALRASA